MPTNIKKPLMLDAYCEGKISIKDITSYEIAKEIRDVASGMDVNSRIYQFAPYITKWLYADDKMLKTYLHSIIVKEILECCPNILDCIDINLYKITLCWGSHYFRVGSDNIYDYIRMIEILREFRYQTNWRELLKEAKVEMALAEQYSDYKRGEVFAFLVGFTQIMLADKTDKEKDELIEQMQLRWSIICPIFAVLIKKVIGTKVRDFAALANVVYVRKSDYAYIYLFHNALMERRDELCKIDTKRYLGKKDVEGSEAYNIRYNDVRRKIDDKIKKIEDILKSCKQEHDLDELINLIFSNLKNQLNKERVKTYAQLEATTQEQKKKIESQQETINDWMKKTEQLESRVKELEPFQDLAISMRNSYLENAIPIETLANSIKAIRDSNVQFQVFAMLNQLLRKDTAWRNHRDELEEEIGKRFFGDENAATHEQTEMLRANLEQQTNILQEVANKKTIGTLVMEQHNHGGGLSLPNTQDQGLLE